MIVQSAVGLLMLSAIVTELQSRVTDPASANRAKNADIQWNKKWTTSEFVSELQFLFELKIFTQLPKSPEMKASVVT